MRGVTPPLVVGYGLNLLAHPCVLPPYSLLLQGVSKGTQVSIRAAADDSSVDIDLYVSSGSTVPRSESQATVAKVSDASPASVSFGNAFCMQCRCWCCGSLLTPAAPVVCLPQTCLTPVNTVTCNNTGDADYAFSVRAVLKFIHTSSAETVQVSITSKV